MRHHSLTSPSRFVYASQVSRKVGGQRVQYFIITTRVRGGFGERCWEETNIENKHMNNNTCFGLFFVLGIF